MNTMPLQNPQALQNGVPFIIITDYNPQMASSNPEFRVAGMACIPLGDAYKRLVEAIYIRSVLPIW